VEIDSNSIELECARLLLRSIRLFDRKEWRGYAELFAPDGVFVRANQPQEPLQGRSAIQAALESRPTDRLTRHLCTNVEIEVVDSTRAKGSCYLVLFSATETSTEKPLIGLPADTGQKIGEYADDYVRIEEGWRIARRVGRLTMYTR
jgi:hypothetical protein